MNHIITRVRGREIIDSRGNPTVEAQVTLSSGITAMASVPSGASTGVFEAFELRDNKCERYNGKGVETAVNNINSRIAKALAGMPAVNQYAVDRRMCELDGTENKSRLGANAILAVSLATARAAAVSAGMPLYRYIGGAGAVTLPVPMMNILNGGAHAANNVDIQEFMIMPVGAKSFKQGLQWCAEVYASLGKILKGRRLSSGIGDEGGFAPSLESDEDALKYIIEAITKAGFTLGEDFVLAVDAAASEWVKDGKYILPKRVTAYTADSLTDYWEDLISKYPIASIEDGVGEEDIEGWQKLTKRLGQRCQLVGDDLFVTNKSRIEMGISAKAANSLLVKVNQIGTLTEAIEAVKAAHRGGYTTIISHRSGETEDSFIADIAVALNSGQIKSGAPARSDRTAKYNRLLRLEEHLGQSAVYPGKSCFNR